MSESSLDVLEKRLQAITKTLINAQIELGMVKEEVEALKAGKTPLPVRQPIEQQASVQEAPVPPPNMVTPSAKTAPKAKPKRDVERFIGGKLITIIGVLILVIGVGIFVKYAVDNDMIGAVGRVTLGILAGSLLLGVAFRLKSRYAAFSAALLSGGVATLYFTVFAAYDFYRLMPPGVAFVLMVLLTIFAVFSAIMYNMQVIAIIGLTGAYAVPLLLSDNSGRVLILFSYMTIVNAGILFLAFRKYWRLTNWVAFVLTWLIVSIWFADRYDPDRHQSVALAFSFVFFMMFYLMATFYKLVRRETFGPHDVVLIALNSFVYYAIGYAIFDRIDNGVYLGGFTVFNAVVHSGFAFHSLRSGLSDRRFFLLEITMMLAFAGIAIPVQMDGNWVTLAWGIGSALLFWIGYTQNVRLYERLAYTLALFSCGSLMDDWTLYGNETFITTHHVILHVVFLTTIIVISSLAVILWLEWSKPPSISGNGFSRWMTYTKYVLLAVLVWLVYSLGFHEVAMYWDQSYYHASLALEYGIFNEDLLIFKDVWLSNYSAVFVLAGVISAHYRFSNRMVAFVVLSFALVILLMFFFRVLPQLSDLHRIYLADSGERMFPVSSDYIRLRYFCYVPVVLLVWSIRRLCAKTVVELTGLSAFVFHLLLVTILSFELSALFTLSHPAEWVYYDDLATRLGFSLLWAIYALVLITVGIWQRRKLDRLFGIGLLAATLIKLYVYDLRDLSTGPKIILFIALGLLLLVIAFLYQKFKTTIFAEDEPS